MSKKKKNTTRSKQSRAPSRPIAPLSSRVRFAGYITAFIDMLGVSRRFDNFDSACLHDPKSTACREAAAQAFGPIERFRENFRSFYKEMSREFNPPELAALPLAARKLARETFVPTHTLQGGFDCLAISIPLDMERELATWRGLMAMTAALSGAQVLLLGVDGVLCRGGIALGLGGEVYKGEIMGANLSRAVALEKGTCYPRIAIDERVISVLREVQRRPEATPRNVIARAIAMRIMARCCDDAGTKFLDFANEETLNVLRRVRGEGEWKAFLLSIRHTLEKGAADGAGVKIQEKFRWVQKFLETRLGLQGLP